MVDQEFEKMSKDLIKKSFEEAPEFIKGLSEL